MSEPATLSYAPANRSSQTVALLSKLGPLIGLVFVWALFAALKGHDFIKWDNQRLMLLQTAVVGTAANDPDWWTRPGQPLTANLREVSS